jgi:hypothetical protein
VDRAAIGDFEKHRLLVSRQAVFERNFTLDPVELRSWLSHSTQSAAWTFPCWSRSVTRSSSHCFRRAHIAAVI